MRISIIGAGRVGLAVARNWRRCGHEIQFAVRDSGAAKYAVRYPQKPLMLIAGDDDRKKPIVAQLVTNLGFKHGDAGPMINARLLEAHAMLWVDLAMKRGFGRNVAFGLLRAA